MPKDNEAPVEVIQGEARARLQAMADENSVELAYGAFQHRTATMITDVRKLLAFQSEAPAQGEGESAADLWQDLLDKDDRTSPEDYPDHALITRDELADYIARATISKTETVGLPLADREAIARQMYERFVGENGGFYNEEDGSGFGTWEEHPDKSAWLSAAGFCLSLPPSPVGEGVTTDVRRLVIAARMVAFDGDCDETKLRELDQASEAFADRVPWDDEPTTPTPAPVRGE